MASQIHPTSIIESGAQLGAEVEIGPCAFVGHGVTLGAGTRLHHHAAVEGNTILGEKCEVYPYACIGGQTQDLKFKGGNPGLRWRRGVDQTIRTMMSECPARITSPSASCQSCTVAPLTAVPFVEPRSPSMAT